MTTVMRMLMLVVAAALLVSVAAAQDMPRFDSGELEMPSDNYTMMPSDSSSPADSWDGSEQSEQSMVVGPVHSAVDGGASGESFGDCESSESSAYDLWDLEPVPIESTGTWLNRGLWYAQAEVLVMMRLWSAPRPGAGIARRTGASVQ